MTLSAACSSGGATKPGDTDSQESDASLQNDAAPDDASVLPFEDAASAEEAGATDGSGPDSSGELACGLTGCGQGQHCDQSSGAARCVDSTCADLTCTDTEECAQTASGGAYCKSIACSSDVQCGEARHCDGAKCVDDVCEPGAQRCDGNQVYQCSANGGSDSARFMCAGNAYFASSCGDSAGGVGCSCQDDWDCPNFTDCVAGVCQGSGVAPTCTLPAQPFEQVLPTLEFRWGGESTTSKSATGRAFAESAQVAGTPVVINLNDDNGDGLINEFDFPEILFTTYVGTGANSTIRDLALAQQGVLRAVHGGGPDRGKDYFAVCGSKRWFEGDDPAVTCDSLTEAVVRPAGGIAAGDLDGNGVPEIVVVTKNDTLLILNNRGEPISESTNIYGAGSVSSTRFKYPQVGLANLDNKGLAEVIVGRYVLTLEKGNDGVIKVRDRFSGQVDSNGAQDDGDRQFGPTACPANLIDDDGNAATKDQTQEIVAGSVLFALPTPPTGVTRISECASGDPSDFCNGRLATLWNAKTLAANTGATSVDKQEAYCAVADVLGANTTSAPGPANRLDGKAEVILVSSGVIYVLEGSSGAVLRKINVEVGQRGGAPNVDDFDGDGFPEIAMASSGFYTVVDLQATETTFCPAWDNSLGGAGANPARNPGGTCTSDAQCNAGSVCNATAGSCVCLHNGWKRITEDDSSKVTSSSVFDFNGDGAAEVVYGDECYFQVYDGRSGKVQLAIPSLSRTVLENPVVADVDNDGNAEIVFVNNNETVQCNKTPVGGNLTMPGGAQVAVTSLPNGIQVWGDSSDTWVSARRIWNEHAYHVTNITESGEIPVREPESWKPYGNRFYNTYRSQPRAYGVAPDLALKAIQVSSPDVACGQLSNRLDIVVLVKNLGDLRVGPGVEITYYGEFSGTLRALRGQNGMPLKSTLAKSLEPGASLLVSSAFRADDDESHSLPSKIVARIDESSRERECVENNNQIESEVAGGEKLADLRLEVKDVNDNCNAAVTHITLHNDGSLPARDVLVRLYAGDPSTGGQQIGEQIVAGPIAPGASVDASITPQFIGRNITVFGVADPLDEVEECNNANNLAAGPELMCSAILL